MNASCKATGAPFPDIFWLGSPGPEIQDDGGVILMMTNIVSSDVYTCVAESILGEIRLNVCVIVRGKLSRAEFYLNDFY